MELIPVIAYGLFLLFILVYSLVQLHLVIRYLFSKRKKIAAYAGTEDDLPRVTLQLPIYNELYVTDRLFDAVKDLRYPKEKLEIQALDDSTDETIELVERKIQELRELGFDAVRISRKDRIGYKAGALAFGESQCKGEFIAIFDADFIPPSDFLLQTLPWFKNEHVGVVQGRWGHLNKNYSIITRLQAFALDAHFTIEQVGRNLSKNFMNFNGTAGIWRKRCIDDAGGWSADTLTEDLDLSYRAQLKSWKFIYLEDLECKAELPAEMNALKAQQFRWSKGAAECARKNLRNVWKSKFSFGVKVHASFHLLNSFLYICILAMALLCLPAVYIMNQESAFTEFYSTFMIFYTGIACITLQYVVSEISVAKNKLWGTLQFILLYPFFLSITMGLSLYNGIGVLEGYAGKKSPFIRTPKFNITQRDQNWKGKRYLIRSLPPVTYIEGLLALYFGYATYRIYTWENYLAMPFLSMLTLGFGFVFLSSIYHVLKR